MYYLYLIVDWIAADVKSLHEKPVLTCKSLMVTGTTVTGMVPMST